MNITKIVASLIAVITINVARAQQLPVDQGHARQMGLAMTTAGAVYYTAPSMDYERSTARVEVVGRYGEEVLNQLTGFEPTITLMIPADVITGYMYARDKYGALIFYGVTRFTLDDLKEDGVIFGLWQHSLPTLGGIQSAEVLVLDEQGGTVRTESVGVDEYGFDLFEFSARLEAWDQYCRYLDLVEPDNTPEVKP